MGWFLVLRFRSALLGACVCASIVGLAACGDDRPRTTPDSGVECTGGPPAMGCAEGEVCLSGRCFAACDDDSDCARTEMCAASGACVRRTTPLPDGGMMDGGSDPCADVACDPASPAPYCRPESSTCAQCLERMHCGAIAPICDVARGACATYAPSLCAPCNVSSDCVDATGSPFGTCIARTEASYVEQVCVPACVDGACPAGMTCQGDVCVPRLGSCTGFYAAIRQRGCASDAECVPIGAVAATGTCAVQPGGADPVCRQPCGTADQCQSDFVCDGEFCVPMPPP